MDRRHNSRSFPQPDQPPDDSDDDLSSYDYDEVRNPSRLKKYVKGGSGIFTTLFVVAIIGCYIALFVGTQSDTSVGDTSKGIQVCIIQSEAFTSHVFISSSDKVGNWSRASDLLIVGDQLTIRGDLTTSWLPLSANGFNTTSVTGSYSDPKFKSNATSTPYLLNSEDRLFALSQQPIISLLVHGTQKSITIPLNTNIKQKTVTLYTLIPTNNGLVLQPEPLKLSNCDELPS